MLNMTYRTRIKYTEEQKSGVKDISIRRLLVGKFIKEKYFRKRNFINFIVELFYWGEMLVFIVSILYLTYKIFLILNMLSVTFIVELVITLFFSTICYIHFAIDIVPNQTVKKFLKSIG